MEGALKELVLNGSLPDPFSKKFSAEAWEDATSKTTAQADITLHACATIIHRYSDAVIQKLSATAYRLDAKATILQRLLMYSTMTAVELHTSFSQEARRQKYWTVARPPRLQLDNGSDLAADDANSIIVDALKLPVGDILPKVKLSEADKSVSISDIDADIHRIVELAAAWNALKMIWDRCLLFGLSVSENDQSIEFVGERSSYFVVGKARQQHITMVGFISDTHKRRKAENHNSFSRDGVSLKFKQSRGYEPTLEAFLVDDFTVEAILPSKIQPRSDATYKDVIVAFEFLSDVAESCLIRLKKEGTYDSRVLDQLCSFSVESLIEAMASALGFSKSIAQETLNVLTYNSKGRFDPWATPVIPANDKEVVLLPGVLCLANRSYALEAILKAQNYDLDTRGPAFENFLHSALIKAIGDCPFKATAQLFSPGLRLETEDEHEEIDLILCIGRDAFIFELKSALFPTEPRDEYNFLRKVREAEIQLERKTDFVARHLSEFQRLHSELKNVRVPPKSVRGIIVTNFHGGPVQDIKFPVSDSSSLVHYFRAGRSILGARLSQGDLNLNPRMTVPYYNSFESFRENFYRYIEIAPHLLPFSKFGQSEPIILKVQECGIDLKNIQVPAYGIFIPPSDEDMHRGLLEVADELRRKIGKLA